MLPLKKASCQQFQGHTYVYGISSQGTSSELKIVKYNDQLEALDSMRIELREANSDEILPLYSDTLHGYLNIYLQRAEKSQVRIFRITKKFELKLRSELIDIARSNNSALFDKDVLYVSDDVYSLKVVSDTSGKQFYLNKFHLLSSETNFDYSKVWQFPFERKNVKDAHIFYANPIHVFLYVYVSEGLKKGQWVLKLNAKKGMLEKAIKINTKGETNTYFYSTYFFDPLYRSIHIIGEEFQDAQASNSGIGSSMANLNYQNCFHLEIDSLGELVQKNKFRIPINTLNSGAKKISTSFILKCQSLHRNIDGKFMFDADIYKLSGNDKCFRYTNSNRFLLSNTEKGLQLEKNSIGSNMLIDDYYANKDKMDLNGKICQDSLFPFNQLFYMQVPFGVKVACKFDAAANPSWILCKHSLNKNLVNYSSLSLVNKKYELKTIDEIAENKAPGILILNQEKYLIFSQVDDGIFQLKIYSW